MLIYTILSWLLLLLLVIVSKQKWQNTKEFSVCFCIHQIFINLMKNKTIFFLCLQGNVQVKNQCLLRCLILCISKNNNEHTYLCKDVSIGRIWKREYYYGQPDDDRLWVISSFFLFLTHVPLMYGRREKH